jgi:hypothetical protein
MPHHEDEEHSPSEFYSPGKTNDPNAAFQSQNDAEQNKSGMAV